MKNKSGFTAIGIFLVLIALSVFLGGGYVAYERYWKSKTWSAGKTEGGGVSDTTSAAGIRKSSPSGDSAVSKIGPASDTVTWKTYRNEKYGIVFQYPSLWTFTEEEGKLGFPWLQIRMGAHWPDRVFTFGCAEGIPSSHVGAVQASGIGNDVTIHFAGELVKVIGEKPKEYSEGESPGYSITRCSQKGICIGIFRYSNLLERDDALFIESMKLLKPLESWSTSGCNLPKG